MSLSLKLSKRVAQDIEAIIIYTDELYGEWQAEAYILGLVAIGSIRQPRP